MHHFICMDSFKGCITSSDAARAVQRGILTGDSDATIDWSPVADGGEKGRLKPCPRMDFNT